MHENNGLVPDDVFMSKRLQVAAIMGQGMLANPAWNRTQKSLAQAAVDHADELIAEESRVESTWQERLVQEEQALHEKILLLDEFISNYDKSDPDGEELYDLYVDQLSSMVAYDSILNARIALL